MRTVRIVRDVDDAVRGIIDEERMKRSLDLAQTQPNDLPVPPIHPGQAPGGLVFRLMIDGKLAHVAKLTEESGKDAVRLATESGDLSLEALKAGKLVELVVYDGDTGGWVFSREVRAHPSGR